MSNPIRLGGAREAMLHMLQNVCFNSDEDGIELWSLTTQHELIKVNIVETSQI